MIPLIKSTFHKEGLTKLKLIKFIAQSKYLSFGKYCLEFEKQFATWQGVDEAVFVNSGSSANLALIQALLNTGRLEKGDRVGFSALGWSTTVMPLIQLGLEPVPVDVELDTLNVSSSKMPTDIKAMFLTNLLGLCDDIDQIKKKCDEHNIILLEDNCESMGSVYKGTRLGNFGLASTFSFYVGHHMSTIEGGMIATNDEELARELRIVRAHGWDRNLPAHQQDSVRKQFKVNSSFYSRYTFYSPGYNLRPTEINGFLGLLQLPYLEEIISKRERNYIEMYPRTSRYQYIKTEHMDTFSSFAVPVVCKSRVQRNKLVKKLEGMVEARPIVGGNLTAQPFFKNKVRMPNATLIHNRGLYVGNNPELTDKDKKTIRGLLES